MLLKIRQEMDINRNFPCGQLAGGPSCPQPGILRGNTLKHSTGKSKTHQPISFKENRNSPISVNAR